MRVPETPAANGGHERTGDLASICREPEAPYGYAVLDQLERQLRRLAFNLHDGPMQSLSAARLALERASKAEDADSTQGEIARARVALDRAVDEMRETMTDLRPTSLDEDDLLGKIRDYCAEFERRSGVRVMFFVTGVEPSLSARAQTVVFRILQEALSNVQLHARALRVGVELRFEVKGATLAVSDDGGGFDCERSKQGRGPEAFGLLGMHERARMAGGDLWVLSSEGRGTTIEAWIPADVAWL